MRAHASPASLFGEDWFCGSCHNQRARQGMVGFLRKRGANCKGFCFAPLRQCEEKGPARAAEERQRHGTGAAGAAAAGCIALTDSDSSCVVQLCNLLWERRQRSRSPRRLPLTKARLQADSHSHSSSRASVAFALCDFEPLRSSGRRQRRRHASLKNVCSI